MKKILITQSGQEGLAISLITEIKDIDELVNNINYDKIFFGKGKRKQSLKQVLCSIIYPGQVEYNQFELSVDQVEYAATQSHIYDETDFDIRFWDIQFHDIYELDFRNQSEYLSSDSFCWGDNKEFFLKKGALYIGNRNTGLANSSFFLEEGYFKLIISEVELELDNVLDSISGVPSLCGTEEENRFMEEIAFEDEPHFREYSILSNELNFVINKDYLLKRGLLDKEVFVYLVKL